MSVSVSVSVGPVEFQLYLVKLWTRAVMTAESVLLVIDMIPTCVTELGETLMNELDDAEMLSVVDSLETDHWSSASSASPGEQLSSRIDMQAHSSRLSPSDLSVSACRATAMYCRAIRLPTLGLIAQAVFLLKLGQTDTQGLRRNYRLTPAWVCL